MSEWIIAQSSKNLNDAKIPGKYRSHIGAQKSQFFTFQRRNVNGNLVLGAILKFQTLSSDFFQPMQGSAVLCVEPVFKPSEGLMGRKWEQRGS